MKPFRKLTRSIFLFICFFSVAGLSALDHTREVQAFIAQTTADIQSAKVDYIKNSSGDLAMPTLEKYHSRVKDSLDSGFELWQLIEKQSVEDPALELLEPYLNRLANQYMDVAEEYEKQGALAVGLGIAHEIISNYTDIPLPEAKRRADNFIFENDPDYRP